MHWSASASLHRQRPADLCALVFSEVDISPDIPMANLMASGFGCYEFPLSLASSHVNSSLSLSPSLVPERQYQRFSCQIQKGELLN